MYRNVRQSKQRKTAQYVESRMWQAKPETTRQKHLRLQADAMLERRYGPASTKGFEQRQRKERDRRFFESHEWYLFREEMLRKLKPYCKCGRLCNMRDVRHIQSIAGHFHLRFNPLNVKIECEPCRSGRKRSIPRLRL